MEQLNEYQTDALQELGNIGAAHAATTLSQMLACPIEMEVPQVHVVDIADIYTHISNEVMALVVFSVEYNFTNGGFLVVCMPVDGVISLSNRMLGTTDTDRELSEMDQSAILEIGNIMVSAFLDATAELLGIVMLPSPPALAVDMTNAAFESVIAQVAMDIDNVVIFKMELKSDEPPVYCSLFLVPNRDMLAEIIGLLERLVAGP